MFSTNTDTLGMRTLIFLSSLLRLAGRLLALGGFADGESLDSVEDAPRDPPEEQEGESSSVIEYVTRF